MSRIGRVPVLLPKEVLFHPEGNILTFKGPKGVMEVKRFHGFSIHQEDEKLLVTTESKNSSALHGTLCRLMTSAIQGVSKGFEKTLELIGVGYNAELKDSQTLKLNLGYSHPIFYTIPEGIQIVAEKPTVLKIRGINKQLVGQTASEIVKYRKPEPYKGKGVRISGQFVRMKEGKRK